MENGKAPFTERRRYSRIKLVKTISYIQKEQEPQKSNVSMARTIDISPAGLALEVYQPINPDSILEIEIAVNEKIFKIEGKVVYLRNLQNGNFSVGIMFKKLERELIKQLS